jgi:hypothetical protein
MVAYNIYSKSTILIASSWNWLEDIDITVNYGPVESY